MIKKAVIQPQDASTADNVDVDLDLDLGEVADSYPWIPPEVYDVVFMNKAHYVTLYKRQRLITYWKIQELNCEYFGTELILSFQCPQRGRKWGALSKMAQCYRIAVGRDPDRFDVGRLSLSVFKNKSFRAQVVTVAKGNDSKSRKQVERSPENCYSVIYTLLALNAG